MSLEYLIEDVIDTLEECLDNLKNLNSCDVELYNHIFGDEENNNYLRTLDLAKIDISNAIYNLENDIDYESRRLKKSEYDYNHEPLPTLTEWVMNTLNDIDVNDKSVYEVYNQIFSELNYDNDTKLIPKLFTDKFINQEAIIDDPTNLIDALDITINSMLNNDNYEHLVAFIENIPFKMPEFNFVLEEPADQYFSVPERLATGLVYQLNQITEMVLNLYENNKDLDTDQEEDYDM